MRMGIFLRNFGPVSSVDNIIECAQIAEKLGLDDLWLSDHIAIPPEEAEGSGGCYLDPLATLAFLAAKTERIGLGTSVLIVPYRAPLITAKWLASIQELSHGRLSIGAAVGWMEAEFRAAGVDRKRRGLLTDEALKFWHECFNNDEPEINDQRFVFKPRPERPAFLIGGAAPHAIDRAVQLGDGWMPTEGDPEKLREPIASLTERMLSAAKPAPQVIPLTSLALVEQSSAVDKLSSLAEVGVTGLVNATKYESVAEFEDIANQLLAVKRTAITD
ncbi:MAG: TIGR03619 family F420-dependent LLM class oxidoreductase [Gammaproteobacteria bacterium]|nr:TIGR03619 family F420-dependent LLM class oxidoreductase [Gammaproteobacteria bacterium]